MPVTMPAWLRGFGAFLRDVLAPDPLDEIAAQRRRNDRQRKKDTAKTLKQLSEKAKREKR